MGKGTKVSRREDEEEERRKRKRLRGMQYFFRKT